MANHKERFEGADMVIDMVKIPEEECDLVYTREDGIGIETKDGDNHHIPWGTAINRYVPIRVRERED